VLVAAGEARREKIIERTVPPDIRKAGPVCAAARA
jgi:hypothetical protein